MLKIEEMTSMFSSETGTIFSRKAISKIIFNTLAQSSDFTSSSEKLSNRPYNSVNNNITMGTSFASNLSSLIMAEIYSWTLSKYLCSPNNFSNIRLTVDYEEDLVYLNKIFKQFNNLDFSFEDIVSIITKYNLTNTKDTVRNEGYNNDRKDEN